MTEYKNIGILDVEGININPLTNEPYSEKYKEQAKIWSQFPAYKDRFEIIDGIRAKITSSEQSHAEINSECIAIENALEH